jgi:hypothetical protein
MGRLRVRDLRLLQARLEDQQGTSILVAIKDAVDVALSTKLERFAGRGRR